MSAYKIRRLDRPTARLSTIDAVEFPGCAPDPESAWWALRGDIGDVAGYCILEPWSGGVGFLARSWIHPNHRGNGLQKHMIFVRERHARKAGMRKLVSYTADQNCPSANSLIRCGYRTYTPQELWGLPGCTYWFKLL